MSEKQVQDVLVRVKASYKDLAKRDILNAIKQFKELQPSADQYVSPTGAYKEVFTLSGTIPVKYKNNTYNIPIQVYLDEKYPYVAPLCYVRPTPDMSINVNQSVDANGRITVPYQSQWCHPAYDLVTLISEIAIKFGEVTPLYAKSSRNNQSYSASQYPTSSARPASGTPTNQYGSYMPSSSSTTNSSLPYPTSMSNSYNTPTSLASGSSSNLPYPTSNTSMPVGGASGAYPSYPNPYMPGSTFTPMPAPQFTPMRPFTPQQSSSQPPMYPGNNPTRPAQKFNSNYSDETLKPDVVQMSLVSACIDKARKKYYDIEDQCQAEIDSLRRIKHDLETGEKRLDDIILDAQIEIENIKKYSSELKVKSNQLNENLNKIKHREKSSIEDAIVLPTPLYRQLVQLFAEELAIQDLIYYLNEGLLNKTINLDSFLKQTRLLSRKLFMTRALILKCREHAGLRT